jgi:glycosyltransferase involved in cell wall biosynthesis
MYYSIITDNIIYILLGLALALAVVYALWQWSRSFRLRRFFKYEEERDYVEELPGVSVVVYACNDADWLQRFLPLILHQDYPLFEVIVVDDGSSDNTKILLSDMKAHYDHLHITFTPDDTRQLSRKKLSVMIGIKAAHYDIVLNTAANCRVMSDQWLRLMMRNFTPGTDVVIGYSHYRYSKDKTAGRKYRIFDTVTTAVQYLNSAIKGNPYRGIAENLAYRKKAFFDNSGFSKSMDLLWGDDDIFVSEIADGSNTRVELSNDSQLSSYYDDVADAHYELKLRRDFTSRYVRRQQFVVQGFMSLAYYLRLGALIAAVVMNYLNIIVDAAAFVILVGTWIPVVTSFRSNCRLLNAPRLLSSVPFFTIWRPVVNFYYRQRGLSLKKSNFTSIFD